MIGWSVVWSCVALTLTNMVCAQGSESTEPAWDYLFEVHRDEFSDRLTRVHHSMTARTGWIESIDRPVWVRASVRLSCSLLSTREPDGELSPAVPDLGLNYYTSSSVHWDTFANSMEVRQPARGGIFHTWLEVRVDSKPPIRLAATGMVGRLGHEATNDDTALLDYMKGGDEMKVRVAGTSIVRRLRITGAAEAYARMTRACAERRVRVYPSG